MKSCEPAPLPAEATVFCVGGPAWTALVAALRPGARLAGDAVAYAEGYAEGGFGLALVDLGTPWADPLELAAALRRRHPSVPLAALGEPAPQALVRFGAVGFQEHYPSGVEGAAALAARIAARATVSVAAAPAADARVAALEAEVAALRAAGRQRFAAEVAHDLREPLRTNRLLLERVESQLALGETEAAAYLLARLYDATARMEELIDGALVDLAPPAEGPVAPSSVDRVLDEVLDQIAALVDETGAKIERSPLPELGVAPHQLRQLLQNLLVNAIRHGGTPPRVHVSARRDGDIWCLRVRDWGPGVPEDQREAIFRPLARLAGSAATPGHGLGLAICRKLAERAGGSILAEDAEGGGAVFVVSLPAAVGEERTEEMRVES